MKKTTFAAGMAVLATSAAALFAATPGEAQTAARDPKAVITRAQAQAEAAALFAKADANGDGVLNQADRAAMQAKMFAAIDKDGNGQLTQAELDAARAERQEKWAERAKDRADKRDGNRGAWFARLDTDKSGGISQAEFAAARGPRGDGGPGHEGMDHGGMDHPGMDHGDMNHDGHKMGAGGPGMAGHRMGMGGGMGGGRGMGMLRMADANNDGQVTRDEATAAALKHFDMVDANHDGQIVAAERQAAMQAMRARMEQRRGDAGMAPPPPADDAN